MGKEKKVDKTQKTPKEGYEILNPTKSDFLENLQTASLLRGLGIMVVRL